MAKRFLLHKDANGNVSYGLPGLLFTEGGIGYDAEIPADTEVTLEVPLGCDLAVMSYSTSQVRFSIEPTPIPPGTTSFSLNNVELTPAVREVKPGQLLRFLSDGVSSIVSVSFWSSKVIPQGIPVPIPVPNQVYVMNSGSASVSVIDSNTDTVVKTTTVGTNPGRALSLPNGYKNYIVNVGSNNVSVLETDSDEVILNIPVGQDPLPITLAEDRNNLYVANRNGNSISVIDTLTDSVVQTQSTGLMPIALALTTKQNKLYVANSNSLTVEGFTVGANTLELESTTLVANSPTFLLVHPNDSVVYVGIATGHIVVLDNLSPDAPIIKTIPLTGPPNALVLDENSNSLFVATSTNFFDVINTEFNIAVGNVDVSGLQNSLVVKSDGSRLYGTTLNNNVFSYNINTQLVEGFIATGSNPIFSAFNRDETKLYVSNAADNTVTVIDTTTNAVLETIMVQNSPIFINAVGN